MDGLGLRFRKGFDSYFKQDKFGSFIPNPENLHMELAMEKVQRQLSSDTGLARRMSDIYYRTDVEFTDNPLGNTHVIAAGVKLFGVRPLKKKSFEDRLRRIKGSEKDEKQLRARERRLENFQSNVLALHKKLKDAVTTDADNLLWQVEGDQALTGGGFDNNKVGEVHKAALKFVVKSSAKIDYENSVLSQLVVEGALELRDYLKSKGLREGSLKPEGIRAVRFEQDKDGMMGFPIYAKSQAALDRDQATRLLIETGVDTRSFVGTMVTDKFTGKQYSYRIVDAIGYILDRSILGPTDLLSLVTLLARIQKHGRKLTGPGKFEAKPGKTRAVYPNAAIPGAIEAMTFSSFNDKLQELKVDIMPSLQTREIRGGMIWDNLVKAISQNYDYLAADWSQYDATVKGAILATIIQLAVKPFYNAAYFDWVDASTYILVYKYLITDEALDRINAEEFNEANSVAKNVRANRYIIYGLVDGLISGAKFTHVGGSLYGEVVIHRCIPRLCNHEPIFGAQAGDDTLLGWPKEAIFSDSVERTYTPIMEAAKQFGLELNPSKQIFHQFDGEVVKVFLQEVYQHNLNIKGIGSIFRPYDAVFFSEHDRGLSVAEQEMATISRMNQGYDNPFVHQVVEDWFKHDELIGVLFKEYGKGAFNVLIKASGIDADSLFKNIDVGSFNFGIDRDQAINGNIPILEIAADVAREMSFSTTLQKALERLDSKSQVAPDSGDTPLVSMYDDEVEMLGDQTL